MLIFKMNLPLGVRKRKNKKNVLKRRTRIELVTFRNHEFGDCSPLLYH